MAKNRQHWSISLLCLAIALGLLVASCATPTTVSADRASRDSAIESTPRGPGDPSTMNELPRLEGKATVEMTVKGSPITIEVNGQEAPITAGNFVDLVERGFYNGLTFHRVVKDPQPFVAQGGDPKGVGTGGFVDPQTQKTRYIPLEIALEGEASPTYGRPLGQQAGSSSAPAVVLKHSRGAVAMARSQMPDSASSQFYFALSDLEFLDGDYAVFGYVTSGMDAVEAIEQGDRIESARVVSGLENLKKP